ncbi:MAG: PAS domain-containing protein [Cyanobacteria bacterium SID2]|nr:PAS domain-containing protein [Cyanobacteria bacterium SID2]MBP0006595.1 PAS domain-containing protein [Cyanobacteria bacterium SBC]
MIESLPIGVVLLNCDAKILYVNANAAATFSKTRQDLLEQPWEGVISVNEVHQFQTQGRRAHTSTKNL